MKKIFGYSVLPAPIDYPMWNGRKVAYLLKGKNGELTRLARVQGDSDELIVVDDYGNLSTLGGYIHFTDWNGTINPL